MKKNKKPIRKNLILRLCVFAFAIYAAVALLNMQSQITEGRQRLEEMRRQNEVQRMANKDLARRIEAGMDDETIERLARERWDYAYPDEIIFFDVSGS